MADKRALNADMNIIASSNLTITPLNGSFSIIQQLDDEPNDVGGLTAQELKAKFDEAGLTIQSYINGTLIPEVLGAEGTEEQRQANEAQRKANETARQTAEAGRVAAESGRVSAEEGRVNRETGRVSAENGRSTAEASRRTAESGRVSAETVRVSAETGRVSAETARGQAESGRQTAEEGRVSAESIRVSQESQRQAAESQRQAAFTSSQSERETAFNQSEAQRQAAFNANEAERQAGEAQRQANEAAREVWEDYDHSKTYVPGNKVYYQGSSYVNTVSCTGVFPTVTANWQMIARKGQDGAGGGMSQDEADKRYLQLTGGDMSGTERFTVQKGIETYVDAAGSKGTVRRFAGNAKLLAYAGLYYETPDTAISDNENISDGDESWSYQPADGLAHYGKSVFFGNVYMNQHQIVNLAAPTRDYDAATKKYVDDTITGAMEASY